jgi:hypothetical protein
MKKSEEKSYVGHVLHFQESDYNRARARYSRYAETISPFAKEIIRLGLSPLTADSIQSLSIGKFERFTNEFKEKAETDISSLGYVFKPVAIESLTKSLQSINAFLSRFRDALANMPEEIDCPLVDGIPTYTPEFEKDVQERFTNRIRTEEGSEFYKKFLIAQAAIQDLCDMGGRPEIHFDFDRELGLSLSGVAE